MREVRDQIRRRTGARLSDSPFVLGAHVQYIHTYIHTYIHIYSPDSGALIQVRLATGCSTCGGAAASSSACRETLPASTACTLLTSYWEGVCLYQGCGWSDCLCPCLSVCRALLHLSPFYSLVVDPSAVAFMHIFNGLLLAQELEEEDRDKDKSKDIKSKDIKSKEKDKDKSKDSGADGADLFSCAAAAFSLEEIKAWLAKQSSAAQHMNGMPRHATMRLILTHIYTGHDRLNYCDATRRRRGAEEEGPEPGGGGGGQESVPDSDGRAGGQLGGPAHPAPLRPPCGNPPCSAIQIQPRTRVKEGQGRGVGLHYQKRGK